MREFLENKTNSLSEIPSDLSLLSDDELKLLFVEKLDSALPYMRNSGYELGYEEGVESQRNN
jgi:hypothetical protein